MNFITITLAVFIGNGLVELMVWQLGRRRRAANDARNMELFEMSKMALIPKDIPSPDQIAREFKEAFDTHFPDDKRQEAETR